MVSLFLCAVEVEEMGNCSLNRVAHCRAKAALHIAFARFVLQLFKAMTMLGCFQVAGRRLGCGPGYP